ncbi:ANTAR domain-containing protein [Streptomyces sp. NPDC006632]|uniref:ANTAR domain-containing protein n=1 Tax=Streptomyces sp. NPDC006632 TaxID=3157182 RepID=UPI0033AA5EF5
MTIETSGPEAGFDRQLASLRAQSEKVRRAAATRMVIERALGMVTVLVPCTGQRARALLVDVARHCDVSLRAVAAALVAGTEGEELPDVMQHEIGRALRRLRSAEQH